MSQYIKKAVEVEAFKLGIDYMPDWFIDKINTNEIILYGKSNGFEHYDDTNCDIKTLEGTMHANYGDYIIKGIAGEIYPCKADIFLKTYKLKEEMAEADKMFEELGYKRKVYQDTDELFELRYENNGKEIWFDKLREEFGSLSGIGIKELQAINKKVEELKWMK